MIEQVPTCIDYELIRSTRRKTLAIQIRQGEVTVRAPIQLPSSYIDKFVESRRGWIFEKLDLQKETHAQRHIDIVDGGVVPYLGEEYRLTFQFATKSNVTKTDDTITLTLSNRYKNVTDEKKRTYTQKLFFSWLQTQAESFLVERTTQLAQYCALTFTKISIKRYKARWGSCNSRQEISLNTLLMSCPLWVIDYVIIHELCHTEHLNHSAQFWQLVAKYCPEYAVAKNWLRIESVDLRS